MRYTITTTDRDEGARLLRSDDAFALIWDIDSKVKNWLNYGIPENKTNDELLEELRTDILESDLMRYWN